MRLVEFFLKEAAGRQFVVSVWVDYAAHRGDLPLGKFASRAEWLEDRLNEIADMCGMGETGSGGYIGSAGGARDIAFSTDPVDLQIALGLAQQANQEFGRLQQEIEGTVAKLGMKSSFEYDYSISLELVDPVHDRIRLGGMGEIAALNTGTVSIEQLIDNASEGLMEAKAKKSVKVKAPPPRNFVAKNAKTSGAGSHKTKNKKLQRDEKRLKDD